MAEYIQTVSGRIDPARAGLTLPHEHILVDFIGADESGPHRYDRSEVIKRVLPVLKPIAEVGVQTFIECTPVYLARDVHILRECAQATSLQIVTNTGQYKEPFLPDKTIHGTPEAVAEEWISEFTDGIDGTDVKPGFIKTAVNPEPLAPVQQTVIRAAALTSAETGLPIATHTGVAVAAGEILDILESHHVSPDRWIFVHAQNEENVEKIIEIAGRGAWIELDGLNPKSEEKHLAALLALLEAGFGDKVLLSHDSGWYRVGEPDGGIINGYTFLFDSFIPRMQSAGVGDETIGKICSENPGKAFAVRKNA